MAGRKRVGKARPGARRKASRPAESTRPRFVGRDPSPVLDHYPPKASAPPPPPPLVTVSADARTRPGAPPAAGAPAGSPGEGLIRLERPFDPDEFSEMLGETRIRVTVPPDALAEVLRRVTEFMGFGIYVYAITVRPAASELLKGYVVELQRVDYDPEAAAWKPFVERGSADSPPADEA